MNRLRIAALLLITATGCSSTPPARLTAAPGLADVDQQSCREVFAGKATGDSRLVLVWDRTASMPDAALPASLAEQISRSSLAGDSLTLITVNGAGVRPSVLLHDAALSSDGPRDAPSVATIAEHMPGCVAWLADTATPQGTGSDFYAAAALAAEGAGPHTTVWWHTDLLANTGGINLNSAALLRGSPAQAVAASVPRAPLDLHGAAVRMTGLANTVSTISPQGRTWLTGFAQGLCTAWRGKGCAGINREPSVSTGRQDTGLPADPQLPFPGVQSAPPKGKDPGCYFEVPGETLFDGDAATLRADARAALKDVIASLQSAPKATAIVTGHTASSSRYTAQQLRELSHRRADAVAAVLRANGIQGSRITVNGVGDTDPIAADLDAHGRQIPDRAARERRVNVLVNGVGCPS